MGAAAEPPSAFQARGGKPAFRFPPLCTSKNTGWLRVETVAAVSRGGCYAEGALNIVKRRFATGYGKNLI